jgi:hypothetical protein
MESNKVEKVKTKLKWCSRCGIFKPLSEFNNHDCTYDRKQRWCKSCEHKKAKRSKTKPVKIEIKFILKELTP